MDPFIGEIRLFGGNFAPRGWEICDGRLLNIASYTPLFSLIGTYYGGNGLTTFGVPDLRGSAPVSMGYGWPGETGTLGTTAEATVRTVAMNYIICVYGNYPSRD